MPDFILVACTLATVLSGGVFFSWAVTVVPGLSKLSDAHYLSAMQSMNREIQNPVFFAVFFGAAILLPISAYQQYGNPIFWWIVPASVFYWTGVMGVTVFANVPLNNMLDAQDLSSQNLKTLRDAFEAAWNRWNIIRAIASVATIGLLIVGLTKK
ncbi:anthrone oxygenase family protein [Flavobacterium selenitireducens]|uniref:anthrone oxygenase family protein n=1 Tax=Flavobacterium selenitireducens TaxID=2722704 RepID=UPI00168B20BF|nr:anthrone oxygenase family protein [Flavobacterium selenitireducens]MBD3581334.1 DUF1772 domain-containing protein [Flavobacterium selenitireducens]